MVADYLLDSNTVIDFLALKLSPNGRVLVRNCVNKRAKISVMTEIEVQSKPVLLPDEEQLIVISATMPRCFP